MSKLELATEHLLEVQLNGLDANFQAALRAKPTPRLQSAYTRFKALRADVAKQKSGWLANKSPAVTFKVWTDSIAKHRDLLNQVHGFKGDAAKVINRPVAGETRIGAAFLGTYTVFASDVKQYLETTQTQITAFNRDVIASKAPENFKDSWADFVNEWSTYYAANSDIGFLDNFTFSIAHTNDEIDKYVSRLQEFRDTFAKVAKGSEITAPGVVKNVTDPSNPLGALNWKPVVAVVAVVGGAVVVAKVADVAIAFKR